MEDTTGCPTGGGEGVAADAALLAAGWARRFLAGPERAAEALELYRSMGFEVRAEKPAAADFGGPCAGCAQTGCRDYLMIYTRPSRCRP